MGVYNIYFKRKKAKEREGKSDTYKYDKIPEELRIQIIHIWKTAIGPWRVGYAEYNKYPPNNIWNMIHDILCRELGLFSLSNRGENPYEKCCHFLLQEQDVDKILSLIEITFRGIENICSELSSYQKSEARITQEHNDAIEELNYRFKEHNIGYQYVSGNIITIDSQYIHTEIVRPAISLLQQVGFEGASEEFLNAHKHYREGRNKEAIFEALKSFESTMKSICSNMKWDYPENATAKPLLDLCFSKGIIPKDMESHFNSLRATLESGLPTVSNKLARHGQGKQKKSVPDRIAAYALHLAATNIVFLVESYIAMKK